ncbi:monocarboxylate transporter 14-like [Haliotis rufescens]|uniref:monocarboxylate transporter 14-like n=1 Tax=Haliotis rufescens TaxID=6454 RepID=UPI00201E893A|nr:monocarboxylate transporter 14-like [Haliotis rufescens]XP_046349490.2 monocarboxylate transporter 14-like [Haliotis rufescens]XP_046349495.2 monocarboxylate transporter 14-like [Haliotis rufescens]
MTKKDVDEGWAWVVLVASYMNGFLLSGVCYMGGMFQVVLLEHFKQSVGLTAWVTSVYASLMLFAGPLASVITSYFDCRTSVMLGGLLLAGGLAGSSFATSLSSLFVSFGIIAGLGLGLSYTPSIVIVSYYFEKKRTLVTSVALSAAGTGLLIAPLLFRYLLDNYAWQQCMVILAGICVHVTLFGALMFPIHERKDGRVFSKCRKQRPKDLPEDLASSQLLNGAVDNDINHSRITSYETDKYGSIILKDDFEATENGLFTEGNRTSESQLDIFKNVAFVVFCVNQIMVNAACGVFNIHLPAFCESYGTSAQRVSWVLSVNGPANIVSRILLGAFAHASERDVWVLYYGVLLTSGTIFCLMPLFAKTYLTQLIAVILIGTYLGGSYSLPPVLTIECVGLKKLASAFGVTMICAGSGWLVAPPIAGWFVDLTGSYDYSMYLAGVLMFLSVLLGLVVPQLIKSENQYHIQRDHSVVIEDAEKNDEGTEMHTRDGV